MAISPWEARKEYWEMSKRPARTGRASSRPRARGGEKRDRATLRVLVASGVERLRGASQRFFGGAVIQMGRGTGRLK